MKKPYILAIALVIFSFSTQYTPAITSLNSGTQIFAGAKFYRTELYFGMDIPGGGTVSEDTWSKFLKEEVTPKFPDGFTVVEAYGQFRDKEGKIGREKSRVLILLYPKRSRKDADQKIEEIRRAYVKTFQQESVLRMDLRQTVRVSF